MKILSIGDMHGDDTWKKVKENADKYDKIICHGDYVDSYEHTSKEMINNFRDIIQFKKENYNKVELLIGNHELNYILWHTEWHERMRCSGRRADMLYHIYELYKEHINYFKVAYQYKNFLFSHAGLSQMAFKLYIEPRWDKFYYPVLANMLNVLWKWLDGSLMHIGELRKGSSPYGSIFWADMRETANDPLIGFHQVVGHTPVKKIFTQCFSNDPNTSITYIDTRLGNKQFYELNIEDDYATSDTSFRETENQTQKP